MKGIVREILLVTEVIIGIAIIVSLASIPFYGGKVNWQAHVQDAYTVKNSMTAGKLYADAALKYSFYQACFDLLGEGSDLVAEEGDMLLGAMIARGYRSPYSSLQPLLGND